MGNGLEIRLLGELEVRRDGALLALPQSRKPRALIAYLAVQRAPQRRDALCELLWELPDDPRAALRWSLSKMRPLLNDDGAERLHADRERVSFAPNGAFVDLIHARERCAGEVAALGVDDLRALMAMIVQSNRLGASMAATLRAHADLLRTKRRQRAEETARKLPVKILIPLAGFLLPPLFVIVIGPAFMRFAQLVEFLGSK